MPASMPVRDEMKGTYSAAVLRRNTFYSILNSELCAVVGKDFELELARFEAEGYDVLAVYRDISFQARDHVADHVSCSNPVWPESGFREGGPIIFTLYSQSHWDNLFI